MRGRRRAALVATLCSAFGTQGKIHPDADGSQHPAGAWRPRAWRKAVPAGRGNSPSASGGAWQPGGGRCRTGPERPARTAEGAMGAVEDGGPEPPSSPHHPPCPQSRQGAKHAGHAAEGGARRLRAGRRAWRAGHQQDQAAPRYFITISSRTSSGLSRIRWRSAFASALMSIIRLCSRSSHFS